MSNHPFRKAKIKNGQLIRFAIRDAVSGKMVRRSDGSPLYVMAYTPKAARHQSKGMHDGQIVAEAV